MFYTLKSDEERRTEKRLILAIGFAFVVGIFAGLLLMGYHTPAEQAALEQVQVISTAP